MYGTLNVSANIKITTVNFVAYFSLLIFLLPFFILNTNCMFNGSVNVNITERLKLHRSIGLKVWFHCKEMKILFHLLAARSFTVSLTGRTIVWVFHFVQFQLDLLVNIYNWTIKHPVNRFSVLFLNVDLYDFCIRRMKRKQIQKEKKRTFMSHWIVYVLWLYEVYTVVVCAFFSFVQSSKQIGLKFKRKNACKQN